MFYYKKLAVNYIQSLLFKLPVIYYKLHGKKHKRQAGTDFNEGTSWG